MPLNAQSSFIEEKKRIMVFANHRFQGERGKKKNFLVFFTQGCFPSLSSVIKTFEMNVIRIFIHFALNECYIIFQLFILNCNANL